MKENQICSNRISLKKLIIIMWGVIVAIIVGITILSYVKYSEYKEAQEFTVETFLSITDKFDEDMDDYDKLVERMYNFLNPHYYGYGLNSGLVKEAYKLADKLDEDIAAVLKEAGYECYTASEYLRYIGFVDYTINVMINPYMLCILVIIIMVWFNVWYILVSRKTIIVDTDRIICKKGKKIVKEFMIKDVKSVEIVHLKGLRIRGNGIKYKIILLKNAEELRMEITELLSNIPAYISNEGMHKSQYSNAEELRKYKELLESGAINEEEYEIKKKQLLGL